ncbi:MAG TPA: hypothetical protein VHM64_15260 [Candidatus Binatia bacterium]|nr:hypothetical protein [Candidatus Binatia bacterium]
MHYPGIVFPAVFALTTLQVWWSWLQSDRRFTKFILLVWVALLGLLFTYAWLLRRDSLCRSVKTFHGWIFAQLTESRVAAASVLLLAAYAAWYAQHISGKSLIGKDFGAFLYRYILLDQLFPSLVAYNPMLNGGYQTTELLTTGSVGLFLATYPIATLSSIETAFKAQPLLVIILLPLLLYVSGRLVGFSPGESFLSAAFALVMTPIGHMGVGQMLFHGSLPYLFSCELAVVIFALSYRVFVSGKSAKWGIPVIVLLGSVAALHPVFLVVMGPIALATVWLGKIPVKQKVVYSVAIGTGLLITQVLWVAELFSYDGGQLVSDRLGFSALSLLDWLEKLEQNFLGFQVPLVFASVIGIRTLLRCREHPEKRRLGGLLLIAVLYYGSLSSIGYFIVAQLQPMRFVVPLSFFLSLAMGPSLPTIKSLWNRMACEATTSSLALNFALVILTILVCLPYSVFFVGFPTASPANFEMIRWLRENVNDDGRVFFYVPDGGAQNTPLNGQLSFYQVETDRPLMGVPAAAMERKSVDWIQGIGECLNNPRTGPACRDLYNVRYAVTLSNRQNGLSYDHTGSGGFRLVKTIEPIRIYEATEHSNYFLMGRGEVKQYLNRLAVVAQPAEVHVLKFFWAPGLRAVPPLRLEPYPLPNGKAFIKVYSNFRENFDIVYR